MRDGQAPAGAKPGRGRRSGEFPGVSVEAALSWAVSHADCRLTPSILRAFTAAVYEFATHRRDHFSPHWSKCILRSSGWKRGSARIGSRKG